MIIGDAFLLMDKWPGFVIGTHFFGGGGVSERGELSFHWPAPSAPVSDVHLLLLPQPTAPIDPTWSVYHTASTSQQHQNWGLRQNCHECSLGEQAAKLLQCLFFPFNHVIIPLGRQLMVPQLHSGWLPATHWHSSGLLCPLTHLA